MPLMTEIFGWMISTLCTEHVEASMSAHVLTVIHAGLAVFAEFSSDCIFSAILTSVPPENDKFPWLVPSVISFLVWYTFKRGYSL